MQNIDNGIFFGIELTPRYSYVSFYQLNMDNPETISTVMGAENYEIPTFLAKKRGVGQWYFGREAKEQVKINQAIPIDDLLDKAYENETMYIETEKINARDMLVTYLKKLLTMPGHFYANAPLNKLVITVENVDIKVVDTFNYVREKLGFNNDKLMVVDYKESFYYYTLSQKPDVFLHDVAIFEYVDSEIKHCILSRNIRSIPQVVTLTEGIHKMNSANQDICFDEIVEKVFAGRIISTVYLLGDGFNNDWMKVSLQRLCRNRKVFAGKNLYSRGACYAGVVKSGKKDWPFIYIGDNELKMNLSLKVIDNNLMDYYTLLDAGVSWYEAKGECEVILDGDGELEVWIQKPDSREAKVEILELTDLPQRENKTSRLRIIAKPTSDKDVLVKIIDLGFGEIVPSSNKTWEHIISID